MQAIELVLNKSIPLVVRVKKATDIITILEMADTEKIDLVLWGANEAHMVADRIAESGVRVVLDPLDNIPDSFDSLNSTYEKCNKIRCSRCGNGILLCPRCWVT